MKGIPIALVTAGLLSMAFMGFSGLVKMWFYFTPKVYFLI
jgi:hypothetical protein